ncbi:892_t:CDS:1, partial [Gigaspora rosea]
HIEEQVQASSITIFKDTTKNITKNTTKNTTNYMFKRQKMPA